VLALSLLAREAAWAARRLSRTPGFVAVTVLTLAVATAPSLIFRLVDKAVLPPLPYERAYELVAIGQRVSFGRMSTSYPKLRHLRERSRTMDVSWLTSGVVFLERGTESVRLSVRAVTPNFFGVLGARPSLGRVFGEDERILLSDVTAAEDWPLAREVLERLELPMPDEDDLDQMQPAGDLSVFADLGVPAMEVAMLCEDADLYPDEMLDSIASRLGFGEEFRQQLDEGPA